MAISTQSVRFDAELGPSVSSRAVVFLSGNLNGYDFECLKDAAMYGVKCVRIRVSGSDFDQAWHALEAWLVESANRGVEISVNGASSLIA